IIGPTLGGALVEYVGWRSIFLLIIPICALVLVLTATSVPESKSPKGRRLDAPGQALAIAGLGALALAVIQGSQWGWESIGSMAAFVGSALSAVLFVLRQRDRDSALMPLTMFKNRVFSASLGIAAAMTFGMYAMLFPNTALPASGTRRRRIAGRNPAPAD